MNNDDKEKDILSVLYLIQDGSLDIQSLSEQYPEQDLTDLLWGQQETPPVSARVLLYLDDERIRELAPLVMSFAPFRFARKGLLI